jgi:hypothetical protein
MPKRIRGLDEPRPPKGGGLAERLADELRASHESGQPTIDEQQYPSGKSRVTVIWDDWDPLNLEDRTAVISRAYELAEGPDSRNRIALASGLTVPEAYSAGMLPFQVFPAIRKSDPVSVEECRKALIEEGASLLVSVDNPQLRFASADEAEAARNRLIRRLPKSEAVWVVTQDVGRVEDWAQR